MAYQNTFGVVRDLEYRGGSAKYYSLPALQQSGFPGVARLPYSLKILLENLLRHEDGASVRPGDIQALANWDHSTEIEKEIAFTPARVLLHRGANQGAHQSHKQCRRTPRDSYTQRH